MYIRTLYFLVLLLCTCMVRAEDAPDDTSYHMRAITRLINECGQKDDPAVCFKMKAVTFLDRIVRAPTDIPINDYISLRKEESTLPSELNDSIVARTEQELDQALPRGLDERSRRLDDLLWKKLITLISTRNVHFNFPEEDEYEDGRKLKKKKKGGMMLIMMMGGMIMKLMMGKIGILAAKALIVGKIALILSLVMLFRKMAPQGMMDPNPPVVYGPPDHGGGGSGYHRRSFDAHTLAYGTPGTR